MALREGPRRWLMRLAWGGLLVAASLLVGLRIGRPVYYTDGQRERSGADLATSGMLEWGTPESTAELPGPVQGRVAALPDGRLLYGRSLADGTTDLVVFDPQRPAVPPEPAYGLNTAQNELAPAMTRDGRLLFASDRAGGFGGYDLYVATWHQNGFGAPIALAVCNTALDETDPAPAPDGDLLVFVRIDPQHDAGNDGVLQRVSLQDGLEPFAVFAETPARRRGQAAVDRDPAFTPDGAALWFVRKEVGQPLRLLRASLLQGAFDAPVVVGRGWGTGELRAPLPSADGLRLGLLQPRRGDETAGLWFVATAHEVYPWWPGQRWLEWVLLATVGVCLLLLLLLHFGRRWSTLDLVAQCLLLSLLLHVLIYLWLMGVEILGSAPGGTDDGGGMQVSIVTQASAGGERSADGQLLAEVAAMAQLTPSLRDLTAAAPGAEVEKPASAELAGPAAERSETSEARDVTATVAMQDAVAAVAPRAGADAEVAPSAASLPEMRAAAQAAIAAQQAERANGAVGAVVVTVPKAALATVSSSSLLAASGPATEALAAPTARAVPVAEAALHDAAASGVATTARAGQDPSAAVALSAQASALPAATNAANGAAEAEREVSSPSSVATGTVVVQAPAVALPRSAAVLAAGGSPTTNAASPLPMAKGRAVPVVLHDAAAAPVAGATKSSAATAAPASVVPLATTLAGPVGSSLAKQPAAAASAAGAATPALPTASPAPSTALDRVANVVAAPRVGALAESAPRRAASRRPAAPVALRDGAAAAAPVAKSAASGAVALAAAMPVPIVGLVPQGPQAATFDRPQRRVDAGQRGATTPIAASVPGSLLERLPGTVVAAPALAAPIATTAYSNRFGPAKTKALEQFGGTAATERAVANGLRYLARIQNADGSWGNREDFDGKYGLIYVGKTALCVLAFLGAGHTPQSNSEHSANVQRAVAHLLALQDPDTGALGPSSCYGHGIATYALAECYGLTKRPELRQPLERALTWILDNQGPRRDRRNRGGWGYFSPGLQAEDDYARVSVSSWMIMALESARLSGIELPEKVLPGAREFLELSFDQPNGWFRYTHKPSRVNSAWPTLPASTPAAAFCLLLLGAGADDAKVQAGLSFTVERRPLEYRRYDDDDFVLRGQGNVYFWYYGTLACFLAGGETWAQWNERLSTVLPQAQGQDGSFQPIDVYAEEAGDNRRDRSYTTAMCVLCLEVYYRYFTPLLLGR